MRQRTKQSGEAVEAARLVVGDDPLQVRSRSGVVFDTSGTSWRISDDHVLDVTVWAPLPDDVAEATLDYFRHLIRTGAPSYVASSKEWLSPILRLPEILAELRGDMRRMGHVGIGVFWSLHAALSERAPPTRVAANLQAFKRWYLWCLDAGYPSFDDDVGATLEAISFKTAAKGGAVLRHDPAAGPLTSSEMDDLVDALVAATEARLLPLDRLAVAWLFVCFGTNPKNVRLIEEEDLLSTMLASGETHFELRIPRIKKRTKGARDQYKTRQLTPVVGRLLVDLIEQNRSAPNREPDGPHPLFRAMRPRNWLVGTPFARQAWRRSSAWAAYTMIELVKAFDLRAADGSRLRISPRRLRYTFATRLVREGCSPVELAEALDHSSTATVMVYFNARLDAVEALDAALADKLAPFALKCGPVVENEGQALRGDDPNNSRVYHVEPSKRERTPVGTCGNLSPCGLLAPLACYTCRLFQPWLDSPHERVLTYLLAERDDRLVRGCDTKWTSINDNTIRAVSRVIQRCAAMKDANL